MKKSQKFGAALFAALWAVLLCASLANAQVVMSLPNEGATGTTVGLIAKLTGAPSTAITTTTGDLTTYVLGVVVGETATATTGNALIAINGIAPCTFDGATTAGDFVQVSATVAGNCHDAGATTPTNGGQTLGRVLTTNGSGGLFNMRVWGTPGTGAALGVANTWTGVQTFTEAHGGGRIVSGTSDGPTVVDCGNTIHFTSGSGITVTMPNNITALQCTITFIQEGAGQITFAAGSGATIHNRSSFTKSAGQWGVVNMILNTNAGGTSAVYTLAGDGAS